MQPPFFQTRLKIARLAQICSNFRKLWSLGNPLPYHVNQSQHLDESFCQKDPWEYQEAATFTIFSFHAVSQDWMCGY